MRRRRRADADRFAGKAHMARMPVGVGIDRDAFNAHLVERADDPAGNGAAIGNEDFRKHRRQAPSVQINTSIGVGL